MIVTKTVIGDNAMRMSHSLNWRLDGFGPLLPLFSIHLNPFCFPLILLERDNLLFFSKFLRNIVEIIIWPNQLVKKAKVSILKIVLFESILSGSHLVGSFTILEICSFRWEICEICFFSKRRFLSLWGQYFILGKEIRLFSFSCGGRFGNWTGPCSVLFQIDERFFFEGGLLFLQKMTNVILPKYSEFYEWGLFWRLGGGEGGGILWESGSSILVIRCWAWSQTCCERGSSPGGRVVCIYGSKWWRRRTVANI